MLARMAQKQEPFPDPPEIRDRRAFAYHELARSGRVQAVDASGSIEAVHRVILGAL
jgi:hypothetical protein